MNYCFSCGGEAVAHITWWDENDEPKKTFMCQNCLDAFEFGASVGPPGDYSGPHYIDKDEENEKE